MPERRRLFQNLAEKPPAAGSADAWNKACFSALSNTNNVQTAEVIMGRGILLWLLGVPIPIIILFLLFWR